MARGKVKFYDDRRLVHLLAGGEWTYAQIAADLGLSEEYVGKVARGHRRAHLLPKIRAARQARAEWALALAANWARALVRRHIQVGLGAETEGARRCREYVMDCMALPEAAKRRWDSSAPAAGRRKDRWR